MPAKVNINTADSAVEIDMQLACSHCGAVESYSFALPITSGGTTSGGSDDSQNGNGDPVGTTEAGSADGPSNSEPSDVTKAEQQPSNGQPASPTAEVSTGNSGGTGAAASEPVARVPEVPASTSTAGQAEQASQPASPASDQQTTGPASNAGTASGNAEEKQGQGNASNAGTAAPSDSTAAGTGNSNPAASPTSTTQTDKPASQDSTGIAGTVSASPGTGTNGQVGADETAGKVVEPVDSAASRAAELPAIPIPIPTAFNDRCDTKAADPMSAQVIGVMHFYESAIGEQQQTTPQEQVGKRWITYRQVTPIDPTASTPLGIPTHAGVVITEELNHAVQINIPLEHALAVSVSVLRPDVFVIPAIQADNGDMFRQTHPLFPVPGMRIRLRMDFDIAGKLPNLGPLAKCILQTLQTYGAIVVERGVKTPDKPGPVEPFCILCNLPDLTVAQQADLNGLMAISDMTFLQNLEVVRVEPSEITFLNKAIATGG